MSTKEILKNDGVLQSATELQDATGLQDAIDKSYMSRLIFVAMKKRREARQRAKRRPGSRRLRVQENLERHRFKRRMEKLGSYQKTMRPKLPLDSMARYRSEWHKVHMDVVGSIASGKPLEHCIAALGGTVQLFNAFRAWAGSIVSDDIDRAREVARARKGSSDYEGLEG